MITASDCIISIDHLGRITSWNRAAAAIFGWKREDALGKTLAETIIAPEYRDAHLAYMADILDSRRRPKQGKWVESTVMKVTGQTFPIGFAVTPLLHGVEQFFIVQFRNVLDKKEFGLTSKLQSTALNAAPNGIYITDTRGIIVWANPAFVNITGYDRNDIIGESTRMFNSGEQSSTFYEGLWKTIQTGKVWQGELVNRRKDGSLYTQEMIISPVTDDAGNITNFVAITQDLTERIQVQEQLNRNQTRQQIISYFATSIAEADTVEQILWDITQNCISEFGWEDAVVYLVNEDRTALVQRAAFGPGKERNQAIVNPIEIAMGKGIVGTVALTGVSELVSDVTNDARYIIDDKMRGSEVAVPIICENQVYGVIDSEHTSKHFYQHYDMQTLEAISSLASNKIMRSLALQKIEESEVKYRTIFEAMQDVYVEVGFTTGKFLEVSPSVEDVIGYSPEELIGQPFSKFLGGDESRSHLLIEKLIEEGEVNDFELNLRNKNGDMQIISFTGSLVKDEEGQLTKMTAIARDISLRKEAERSLREGAMMKTNFVANVSHELRTPMASIMGFASTIMNDKNMAEETRQEFTKIIYTEGQRLTRLITNILDISRMEVGGHLVKLRPNFLGGVIAEAIDTQSILAVQKGVEIKSDLQDHLPLVNSDLDSVKQLTVNLISNAIKFTESGGSVTIRLLQDGKNLVLSVEDTGMGIPKTDLNQIFEKFYRVERKRGQFEGTGIGLTIVQEIVEQHDAEITVESNIGKGTAFRVAFPVLEVSR